MSLKLGVTFTCGHVFFPAGHLSRIGGTFDGTLAAPAIRDADPAAAPPEIRTLSGETLFASAVQNEELEQFCRASQIPVRKRPDIWGDLLEPFVDWRASWLPDSVPAPGALAADTLRVGHVTCVVGESRNRRVTHAALAGGRPLTAVTVAFKSPTYFSQDGTDVVTPDPRLIAGSWCRRWNASLPEGSPLAIGDGQWRETSRLLSLAAFDLRTERRDTGHGRDRAGFLGTAELRLARGAPAGARQVLGALARFAEYAGTGAQTTHGFGATTVTSPDG
jgi:hypothetical protein